jgi:arylamine N-acetyltransferase
MDSELLTREEAHDFLNKILKINQEDFESRTGLCFLNTIIERFFEEIPFQNLYVLRNARMPSFEEIKTNVFSRVGGLCFELNVFMGQLLLTLGYNVAMVSAFEDYADELSLPHSFIVANNVVMEGDVYCVDVGNGYPMFFAVPIHNLTVDQESPEYKLGYWEFKYTRETEHMYCLRSFDDGTRPAEMVEFLDNVELPCRPCWPIEYSFSLNPHSYAEAVVIMEPVYTRPLESYFHVNLHCVTFCGKLKLALGYKNRAFLRECGKEHQLKPQKIFANLSDMRDSIMQHFPVFDEEIVELALEILERNQQNSPHLIAKKKTTRKR